ncbi:acrylyl-CoA reductase (NADPH) [Thorsellia kenyensis]|uniref:MDR family oxidoreductase n=1 Tax=Thorsellia kenyensis TaxID=1549888 RepID=A0ABV6CBD6_9GAMM
MIKALMIEKLQGTHSASIQEFEETRLAPNELKILIHYSTLNYKDALAITNKSPIIKTYPMIPGIDFAGEVLESLHPRFQQGDLVVANGFGLGEKIMGGLATHAQVPAEQVIHLPTKFTPKDTMMIGTAGYTAMLAIIALQKYGITPDKGPILVTGSNGGVGSFAIRLLTKLGFYVVAATRRIEEEEYLKKLGASEIIETDSLIAAGKPLQKERFAGAIDNLGGNVLVNICAALKYSGAVASCGMAVGLDFNASVAPFIIRGVGLLGIDSVMRSYEQRVYAWSILESLLTKEDLTPICKEITLEEVIDKAHQLIGGNIRGRLYVNILRENRH